MASAAASSTLGRGGFVIPTQLTLAPGSKVADETEYTAQQAEWTELSAGENCNAFWSLMINCLGGDAHLHGLVKAICSSALTGTDAADQVLVRNTFARLKIPDDCRATAPDSSLKGVPMDWFARHYGTAVAWMNEQGVAPTVTTMARPPDESTARGEKAGPDEIAAFLATECYVKLRQARDDSTTTDDKWAALLSGKSFSKSMLLVSFGLDTHTFTRAASALDDDKKGSDSARWNKLMCDLKARIREVLYKKLMHLVGLARKTKYTQTHMLAVTDLVISADYTMFSTSLWRFSPDDFIIKAAGSVQPTGKLWDSAIRGVIACMEMVYGAKIGAGAADLMINYVDQYAAVDLDDACPSYPGGRAAVFADVPGLAVQHEMEALLEERSTGHAECLPWADALLKPALQSTHESETEDYFHRLRVLTAARSKGDKHHFTCARELQRFFTGVDDWRVPGGSPAKRATPDQKHTCATCGGGHLTKNHDRKRAKKGGGLKGGNPSPNPRGRREPGSAGRPPPKRGGAGGVALCIDHLAGRCTRGSNCKFSHGDTAPSTDVCWGFAKGTCRYGNDCRFAHVQPDQGGGGGGGGGGGNRGGGGRGGNKGGGGGGGDAKGEVSTAEHKQLYGAGMALIHGAVKASPKPKACIFESFSRHSCSSKDSCPEKSKRPILHDKPSQLSLKEQTKLMRDNPDVRNLFFAETCRIYDAFRSLCAQDLLEQIDKLGPQR